MHAVKFGCLKYDYDPYPYYNPGGVNLGDYIQSLAAKQYLPRVDFYQDRDKLIDCKVEQGRLIANGWYLLDDKQHMPPPALELLLTSIHVNNVDDVSSSGGMIEYFKRYSKRHSIGCRDMGTMKFFQSHGVDAYFSSCLTTTLRRENFTHSSTRQGVVLSDVSERWKLFPLSGASYSYSASRNVRKILEMYGEESVTSVTHHCSLESPHQERFRLAKDLLKKYADAKLVITSRIHAALPCLGLGTPVIYIGKYDELRFRGLDEFFNHIWLDNDCANSIKVDEKGFVINGTKHVEYAERLREQCLDFVKNGH